MKTHAMPSRRYALVIVLAAVLGLTAIARAAAAAAAAAPDPIVIFTADQTAASTIHDRDPGYKPTYMVYVDTQRTADEAKKLLDDMGLTQHLNEYKTRAWVVRPVNGTAYDPVADLAAYKDFIRSHRSSNLKIIAVGAGATFVNNVVSKHAYSIAGILTYGGSVGGGGAQGAPGGRGAQGAPAAQPAPAGRAATATPVAQPAAAAAAAPVVAQAAPAAPAVPTAPGAAAAPAGRGARGGGGGNGPNPSAVHVPAYVHAADAAVGRQYIRANLASAKVESPGWTTYTNPGQYKELQRVVVSKQDDTQESLAQAFQNAWTTVFSKNYRLYMSQVESYSTGFDPTEHAEPWELEPYVMYDELGIRYEAFAEDLPGFGLSLRYEYVPKAALAAAPGTVPLVLIMHGNGNDPRTQGESAGWPEVAAKNNIILMSPEWQGRTSGGQTFVAVGERGTMAMIDLLFAKYPQIDKSRVYLTGLSAGANNSMGYGLRNVSRIAAIAASSAPSGSPALIEAARTAKADGNYLPMYSIAGTHDMYAPLPVTETGGAFYPAIRAFALMNDITVPELPDLTVNEIFGLKLDNQAWGELGGRRAMIGTLSNRQGVMIKLVGLDPYGHWNYKPAAADIWAFLSKYRRDTTTGKLLIAPAR